MVELVIQRLVEPCSLSDRSTVHIENTATQVDTQRPLDLAELKVGLSIVAATTLCQILIYAAAWDLRSLSEKQYLMLGLTRPPFATIYRAAD